MRINSVITKMQASEKAYGCSLTFPSTALVELIGPAGLDHISFDSEHGSLHRVTSPVRLLISEPPRLLG